MGVRYRVRAEPDTRLRIEERLSQTLDGNLRYLDPTGRPSSGGFRRGADVLCVDDRYGPRPLMSLVLVAKDVSMSIRSG